jgi:phosphate transport system permease protein
MAQTAASTRGFLLADLRGSKARRRKEGIIFRVFQGAALMSIVISVAIVLSLIGKAAAFVLNVDIGSLWSYGWYPRRGAFDIKTIVAGTLLISGIAMVVATPLGLGAAIFLSEYARPRVRRWLKPILEVLAGIPSVVLGYFAITWINPEIVQRIYSDAGFFTMASAGIAVGVLVTPLVASVSEDALRSVPQVLREASYGLGARKRSTTLKVVVPAAVSGVVAALIIGVSRAIGETMIVAMASGATGGSSFSLNPAEAGQTMTAAMTALAIGSDQVRGETGTFESLYFVGMLLFLMTLALNVSSERFVRRVRQKY